jgi:hypothetical protein
MPVLVQVTLGAGATQISPLNINIQSLVVQDNAVHNIRVGDSTVTTSKGLLLAAASPAPGGSLNVTLNFPRGTILSQWYVAGTQGDVVDVLYEP